MEVEVKKTSIGGVKTLWGHIDLTSGVHTTVASSALPVEKNSSCKGKIAVPLQTTHSTENVMKMSNLPGQRLTIPLAMHLVPNLG